MVLPAPMLMGVQNSCGSGVLLASLMLTVEELS
jgi:hypothetical protein